MNTTEDLTRQYYRFALRREQIEEYFDRIHDEFVMSWSTYSRNDDELPELEEESVNPAVYIPAVWIGEGSTVTYTASAAEYTVTTTAGAASVPTAAELRVLAETERLASILDVRAWVRQLKGGDLSVDEFGGRFLDEIKHSNINQYMLGRGGRAQMTSADWGRVGAMIKEQYQYFRGPRPGGGTPLFDQLENLSAKQIARRATMYINASREAFEKGQYQSIIAAGFIEVFWSLGIAEHCPDCLDQNTVGWRPIADLPFFPGQGSTQCLTNCKCFLTYRDAAGQVRFVAHGWQPVTANLFKQVFDDEYQQDTNQRNY